MELTKRKQSSSEELSTEELPGLRKKPRLIGGNNNSDSDFATRDSPTNVTPAPGLRTLLDFSSLQDEDSISERFDELARTLMHDYRLVVFHRGVETAFEIQEMEFYLQKAVCHEDPFTHGSEEQRISGKWYFHRAPRRSMDASRSATSLTGYRGGSRKGLDLTIGAPCSPVLSPYFSQNSKNAISISDQNTKNGGLLRGGILLRSLRGLSNSEGAKDKSRSASVSGPSLLVDKILELSGAASISELVERHWRNDRDALTPPSSSSSSFSRVSYLYLKRVAKQNADPPRIYKSPRIGIDLSHPGTAIPSAPSSITTLHSRVRFLPKMYRYFTRPRELSKGRPQTLYGLVQDLLESRPAYKSRILNQDISFHNLISGKTAIKETDVKKYLTEYESGKRAGLSHLKLCIGPNGKGLANSPTTYLKMLGALETVLDECRQ